MQRRFHHKQAGFTYLTLMLATLVISIMTAAAVPVWTTVIKREKEEELLFRLDQYRKAIQAYRSDPRSNHFNKYPNELEDLLDDHSSAVPKRYLRRLYLDPMTGKLDWKIEREAPPSGSGLAMTVGAISNIHSSSDAKPLRKLAGKEERYSDW